MKTETKDQFQPKKLACKRNRVGSLAQRYKIASNAHAHIKIRNAFQLYSILKTCKGKKKKRFPPWSSCLPRRNCPGNYSVAVRPTPQWISHRVAATNTSREFYAPPVHLIPRHFRELHRANHGKKYRSHCSYSGAQCANLKNQKGKKKKEPFVSSAANSPRRLRDR